MIRFHRRSIAARPWVPVVLALVGAASCADDGASSPSSPSSPQGGQESRLGAGSVVAKAPPLTTPWTSEVSPDNARPEYPRPQLVRSDWQNLNGEWQFARASSGEAPPFGRDLSERVLVPYPIESALSGIARHEDRMWYRRTFTVPSNWSGRRVQLNFDAVDWQATVYVNGVQAGAHEGGYDAFSFDITDRLRAGENELIVGVYDPTDAGGQPIGKQRNAPNGIFYTASSGIWQTVWLEPTAAAHITRLDMVPESNRQALRLTVRGAGSGASTVEAVVRDGGAEVARARGTVDTELRIPIANAKSWSPERPFLYDVTVSLMDGETPVDRVTSYFGMRTIALASVGGALRPVLNGRFVFQIGTLDQGYWPDGIYTAPTDEAMKFDIQMHKDLGYNVIRKHIKVEPPRWFYWADKLGLLVWQDMPSMDTRPPSDPAKRQFEAELRELVDEHRSSPAVVVWVLQNEGWGQYDQARLANLVKAWDPSRLVDNMSGINCCGSVDGGNGDLADWHTYVGPSSPRPSPTRAAVLGEFGGLGLRVPDHEWSPGNGFSYEMQPTAAALDARYAGLVQMTESLMKTAGLSAAIYTEITDVENEVNGAVTYDRRVVKVDAARMRGAHEALIESSRERNEPVGPGGLRLGQHQSFQVTTSGLTDRYIRHREGRLVTEIVSAASDDLAKKDATFEVVRGLAQRASNDAGQGRAGCYSFESRNYPGHYLRHRDFRTYEEARDGTALFDADATFCAVPGLSGAGVSLESYNRAGHFLRHFNAELFIAKSGGPNPWDAPASFAPDASWNVADPWWRSSADLPAGALQSLRVMTTGFTNRYARHQNGLGLTEVVDPGSSALLKGDATFRIVRGLANPTCYSLESRNFPGHYLRHKNFRIFKDARDGTVLFDLDATFCAQASVAGPGVTLESYNMKGHFIRHFDSELWAARYGGPNAWDNPDLFDVDIFWNVAPPWAP
ncbi:AbfB domain-containing protein [Pendulispora albinea]|uniref:AbfB domain-containing protein n=1 Tax=Pendulispora albinea TaxID=2741071 RepID=A0ABZ2M6Z6_9BACT